MPARVLESLGAMDPASLLESEMRLLRGRPIKGGKGCNDRSKFLVATTAEYAELKQRRSDLAGIFPKPDKSKPVD